MNDSKHIDGAVKQIGVLCCVRLGDANVYHHLLPIAEHPAVKTLHIVRHAECGAESHPSIQFHQVPADPASARLRSMYGICRKLVRCGEVQAIVSFNPFPYGLLAVAAARGKVPYHLGLIGADVYGKTQRRWWPVLKPVLRGSDFVTVTGDAMKREVVGRGLDEAKVVHLPHSIDQERFAVADPNQAEYDLVYVGQLIHRKRIDLILNAVSLLRSEFPSIKLCLVGEGALRGEYEEQARKLGIDGACDFVGHAARSEDYIKKARILVMASDSEGLPFSIMEAMSCGLVPVSTAVGTIEDAIEDGTTGYLVPKGDGAALADRIGRLLRDSTLLSGMRENILKKRPEFSYEHATAVWDGWLTRISQEGR